MAMNTSFFCNDSPYALHQSLGLMRNTELENIQEHSHDVAVIAHLLAIVRKMKFSDGRVCPDPLFVATLALYHDLPEIITGDMPKPLKYHNRPMETTYKEIEREASEVLLAMLRTILRAVQEIPASRYR